MPQAAAAAKDSNQDYTAVDPQQNPLAFVFQNRDALGNMPEDKAVKLVDRLFKRFALPKYQQMNRQKPLEQEEIENLRLQFAARMFNLPFEPVEQKGPNVKPGAVAKTGAVAAAAGAGVIGGLRSIQELREKLQKYAGLEGLVKYDPLDRLLKKTLSSSGPAARTEGKAYSEASATTPIGASVAAGIGHQIPASIASAGVGSILPSAGKAAPLAAKVLMGGSRGAIEGGVFEASRPGGQPQSGANWGAALGAAFPVLGKFFGLGRKALASAPKVAEAVAAGEGATAKAASSETKSLGSLADKAAKDKFGKAFKDLTSAEKAQMPSIMKEEIAKQKAQQAATKKAEVAAAKAGREAEATAKRAAAADAAKQKAAQQAAKRAAVPTQTPAAKQAVAAKAAEENPSIAKTAAAMHTSVGGEESEIERLRRLGSSAKETPVVEAKKPEFTAQEMKDMEQRADDLLKGRKTQKIPEGEAGKKVRAKGGQPASPAQQAADRERIAAKRAEAKSQEFGAALEKHAQEMAGKFVGNKPGLQHIPEVEEAMKEMGGGSVVLSGLQKLRRLKKISDEIYLDSMWEWMTKQFGESKEGL